MKKCAFGLPELEYLGHVISKDGLKADFRECKAIHEWLLPTNLGELQSFLGMANYYSKFVPSFAQIAAPLYELLCKIVKWIWSSNYTEAMYALQKALSSLPIMCLPDFQRAFQLDNNASDYKIGGMLL